MKTNDMVSESFPEIEKACSLYSSHSLKVVNCLVQYTFLIREHLVIAIESFFYILPWSPFLRKILTRKQHHASFN